MFTPGDVRSGIFVLACAALIAVLDGCSIIGAPTVSSTDPADGAGGVPVNQKIAATFSEVMDPATITPATFILARGTAPVAGTVVYAGVTATFAAEGGLAPGTTYTATITTGAANPAGKPLAKGHAWTFTTGGAPDTTAPTVTSTFPANGALSVPINKKVATVFTEAMDPLTITAATFALTRGTSPVSGTVTYSGVTATFAPTGGFVPNTAYTASVLMEATDLAGNTLATDHVWNFTTGAAPDTTAPMVSSITQGSIAQAKSTTLSVPLGGNLAATFSEAMDPLTISTATFTLFQGIIPVPGTVAYAGVTATFNPTNNLLPNTLYTAMITTGAADLAGNTLAANYSWTFTTGTAPDITAPTVSSTVPENGPVGVPLGGNLCVTFSEPVNPLTITSATFTVHQGVLPVLGTVTYAGVTATFNPMIDLLPNTLYTATVTTGVDDLAGNALARSCVWTFTTGGALDITAPVVNYTDPVNGATGMPVNQKIAAAFSEAIDPLTISTATFILDRGTTPILGTVTYAGFIATFTPAVDLAPNTSYTATVLMGAADLAGNTLAGNYAWNFTTGAAPDTTAPTVVSTEPPDGATNVPVNSPIDATLSKTMDPLTISTATITLNQGTLPVPVTVTYVGGMASFVPVGNLAPLTQYTARIGTGVADLAGNTLASPNVWTFTTGITTVQAPVNLGSAGTFAVLAGSTVTNTGPSVITGNLGLSPGTAVTGFPPGTLTGSMFTGVGSAAGQAKLDLTAAYNDAANRSVGSVALPGDISGLTLYPGLYNNASSVILSTGNVTLDALGDVNAVFIFQMGSTLTTISNTQVVLAGGAKASNIFWQVGSSATLGTNSIFKGNILASASITVTTGVALEGRALTQTAAVTLDTNVITVPAP